MSARGRKPAGAAVRRVGGCALLICLAALGGCVSGPEPGDGSSSAALDEACAFWRHQAEYEIQERLDGTPENLRRLNASFGELTTKEKRFASRIIEHVWSLPLDTLAESDYPEVVEETCRREKLTRGGR